MKKVDINVDIAEGFPYDEELLKFATSANICCGEHAGSWELTEHTIALCRRLGKRIGMHPGFPDREHFGRRVPGLEEFRLMRQSLTEQTERLMEATTCEYFKPHGAWYSVITGQRYSGGVGPGVYGGCAGAVFGVAMRHRIPPMLLKGSRVFRVCKLLRLFTVPGPISEGFADRRYRKDGGLVPRSELNALLDDPNEIKAQVLRLARKVDSICVHGDTPDCVRVAELVRKTLTDAGYEVGY